MPIFIAKLTTLVDYVTSLKNFLKAGDARPVECIAYCLAIRLGLPLGQGKISE